MSTLRQRKMKLQHLTVYGYIREEYRGIPDDLKDICYKFYLKVFDEWDVDKSNHGLIIDVGSGIIKAKWEKNHKYGIAYWLNGIGSIILKKGDIESWIIKPLVDKDKDDVAVCVGIIESCKASKDMKWGFAANDQKAGIGYFGAGGSVYDGLNAKGIYKITNTSWKYTESLCLTLDMSQENDCKKKRFGKLMMKKGDDREIILYDKVDMEKEYRFAVCFYLTKGHDYHKIQMIQE